MTNENIKRKADELVNSLPIFDTEPTEEDIQRLDEPERMPEIFLTPFDCLETLTLES